MAGASTDTPDGVPKGSTLRWTADDISKYRPGRGNSIPIVDDADHPPPLSGYDLWDLWPLQLSDGSTVLFDEWAVWFVLSAPALPDPEARHAVARIRLMAERGGVWRDSGNAFPDGFSPGSREWAGSALYEPSTLTVTMYWTVAGVRGETGTSFAQRMFVATGLLAFGHTSMAIKDWSAPTEIAGGDNPHYVQVTQDQGVPGFIKGFRDPAHVRDPANGTTYLLFTGSLKHSASAWNGCIGLLRQPPGTSDWDVLPPVLTADGLNNEQERPHVVHTEGQWYLFWSTQRKVFAPDGPNGPNGLYGAVAASLEGPWRLLNDTGLVAANPETAPFQTYSWWVTADLTVHGFIDYPGVTTDIRDQDPAWRRQHFGGVPAPVFTLLLADDSATVQPGAPEWP